MQQLDYRTMKVVDASSLFTTKGIVGIDEKSGTPIFGGFSIDYPEVHVVKAKYRDTIVPVIDESILINAGWVEHLREEVYYPRTEVDLSAAALKPNIDRSYKNSLSYNATSSIISNISKIYNKEYTPTYKGFIKEYPKIASDFTFGLEFETTSGFIPDHTASRLGLIPLRDGSISGLEYVTIPLSGKKGMQTIADSLVQLEKRTEFNRDCSLHIHFGNLPRTPEFIVALTKILCAVQDEVFDMFPIYKKNNYKVKRKCYTKPLPANSLVADMDRVINSSNLTRNFDLVYQYLSMGQSIRDFSNGLNDVTHHPADPRNTSKWYVKTRYHWVNLIPLIFGNKQTVEFRIHTPTYDEAKVRNFMITCFSILDMARKHSEGILDGSIPATTYGNLNTLNQIYLSSLGLKYSKFKVSLARYYKTRTQYITNCVANGDIMAEESNLSITDPFNKQSRITSGYSTPFPIGDIDLDAIDRVLRWSTTPSEILSNNE